MLIEKNSAVLFILSMQKEFLPTIQNSQQLIDSCRWSAELFSDLELPICVVNHKNLGEPLNCWKNTQKNFKTFETKFFSIFQDDQIVQYLSAIKRKEIIFVGAESHVSIFQSSYDASHKGFTPFVVSDAASSRSKVDHGVAISRMQSIGVPVVTKEMVFFELLRQSTYPGYLDLSIKFLDQRYLRY